MVSDYLKHTRSIEELDELFSRNKELAALAAGEFFKHEISIAISNIEEIQKVAQARVLADSQVASATVMSAAEVKAAQILLDVQKAKLNAVLHADSPHMKEMAPAVSRPSRPKPHGR